MILSAPAKINLHLDVGPRRPDGYHSLQTVFQEIALHDTLKFSAAKDSIRLSITPKGLPTDNSNLIVRALLLLRKKLHVKKGLKVHLTKRIPMGAGLGGGSSDAAAALWGGWLLWNGKTVRPKQIPPVLFNCARQLGADVAFFLQGGTAWAEGIGEKLTPLPTQPKRWLVLVYPRVHVSTPLAYKLLDQSRSPHPAFGRPLPKGRGTPSLFRERVGESVFNSFEPVILKKFPAIAKAKAALIKLGCQDVMMSGSGSTVFGFVNNPSEGRRVLRGLKHRSWDLFLTHTSFLSNPPK